MARIAVQPAVDPQPFLKWAGGKTQLLTQFAPLYPEHIERYIEPFVGSAAVFFEVRRRFGPRYAALSDSNGELINCYQAVRDSVDALIAVLAKHKAQHSPEYYYRVRERPAERLTGVERAARLIYLNKTCYNGLYRVNGKGQFNVPVGRYRNPAIYDPDVLRAVSAALRGVKLAVRDFSDWLPRVREGDFFYVDPPYHPLSATANFTSYTEGRFGVEEQKRLAAFARELDARGCRFMFSNSDTPVIRKLYRGFHIEKVSARRQINSNGKLRGPIIELVIMNYDPASPAQRS